MLGLELTHLQKAVGLGRYAGTIAGERHFAFRQR